ncbi:BspA family leucine-rich repeat surface protein [Butyrivibrio sp. AC2005]|uniref:BspA family leucine-rich repeat surface protein n=1 Tax=Butyrivibrio sp. AC2005 TaxID=1280672 RepID=UPI00041D02AB|nr:BspA family leucine-rich repeat surface protein [Butyrivibrio sp. AC2005]
MRKMSQKRIAIIILTAILMFTQNSTVILAEELNNDSTVILNQENDENSQNGDSSQESSSEEDNTSTTESVNGSTDAVTNENNSEENSSASNETITDENNSEENSSASNETITNDSNSGENSSLSNDSVTDESNSEENNSVGNESYTEPAEQTEKPEKPEDSSNVSYDSSRESADAETPAQSNEGDTGAPDDADLFDFNFDESENNNSSNDSRENLILDSKVRTTNQNNSDWYEYYDYELDDSKMTITLNVFNGRGDAYVYNHAYINGKEYQTYVSGTTFSYHGNINATSVRFEEGCKTVGSHLKFTSSCLTSVDLTGLDTSSITDMSTMFSSCTSLETVEFGGINTSNVTNMRDAFHYCGKLKNISFSGIDTSNVTDMSGMFMLCYQLEQVDLSEFDTSKVENMHQMFNECKRLVNLDLSNFNTATVKNMSGMFYDCSALEMLNISSFDTSNVTEMNNLFCGCSKLEELNLGNFDTSNVKNMSSMFSGCKILTSLDLSSFNTSNVTNMYSMFGACYNLENINIRSFDTSNVTNMEWMFNDCKSLKNIDVSNFNITNVNKITGMFCDCENLKTLDMSSFNMPNVKSFSLVLSKCKKLDVIVTPADNHSLGLPGNFIIDNDNDGKSDDGKTYTNMPSTLGVVRLIRKGAIIENEVNNTSNTTTGFDLTKHGHCVINSSNSFKYYTHYRIPLERYQEVFGEEYTQNIYDQNIDDWGGNCFGMSSTAILFQENKLTLDKFVKHNNGSLNSSGYDDFDNTEDGSFLYSNIDSELTKLIERYQIWQESTQLINIKTQDRAKFKTESQRAKNFKTVVQNIENNKKTYYLSVRWNTSYGNNVGHAMVVDSSRAPEKQSNGWIRIYLYDPNYPYFESFGDKTPCYNYNQATNRYVDINTNNGHWKMDATLDGSGNSNYQIGYTDNNSLLPGSSIAFIDTSNFPSDFSKKATFKEPENSTCIAYSSKNFKVYNSSDKLLYQVADGSVSFIDESAVEDVGIEGYISDSDQASNVGRLILSKGKYKVTADDGSIAFIENGDYAGILTSNSTITLENTNTNALAISSDNSGNTMIVIQDHVSDNEFYSVKTNLSTDNGELGISLNKDKLTIDTAENQKIDLNVITKSGQKKMTNIATDDIKNLDVDDSNNTKKPDKKRNDNITTPSNSDTASNSQATSNNRINNVSTDDTKDLDVDDSNNTKKPNENRNNNIITPSNSSTSSNNQATSDNQTSRTAPSSNNTDTNVNSNTIGSESNEVTISQNKKKISYSKLKKKSQKVKITVDNTTGTITTKNTSSKKIKKYMSVSVSGQTVTCKLKKGATKGTYKIKVSISGDSNTNNNISKTIKIKVK